ncbi:MAG: hypothetical protein HKN91_05990, partial [Acidimicrobiia bacterium]|nr:hypothetical protein [Acidimicrobiia bacterium]
MRPAPEIYSRTGKSALLFAVLMVASIVVGCTSTNSTDCTPQPAEMGHSVARRWNEVTLDAIRSDLPAPTVHARNLFHTSAAMWDAWAAYDVDATGIFVEEKHTADDPAAARNEAISYAAYRVLEARYEDSFGGTDSLLAMDDLMDALCYRRDTADTDGDTPAALGNRIAAAILEQTLDDGSNEANAYAAEYTAINQPLVVAASGTAMSDPNRWQPLQIGQMISQNGIAVENGVQEFIDPHWGSVDSFALPDPGPHGVPIDPGEPPYLGVADSDEEFKAAAAEVIRYS